MYGAIPDVVISKPPRKNQYRVVVALCVGVLIGALGTAMLFPQSTKETESPTAAPRPILAATEDEKWEKKRKCLHYLAESDRLNEMYYQCLH